MPTPTNNMDKTGGGGVVTALHMKACVGIPQLGHLLLKDITYFDKD